MSNSSSSVQNNALPPSINVILISKGENYHCDTWLAVIHDNELIRLDLNAIIAASTVIRLRASPTESIMGTVAVIAINTLRPDCVELRVRLHSLNGSRKPAYLLLPKNAVQRSIYTLPALEHAVVCLTEPACYVKASTTKQQHTLVNKTIRSLSVRTKILRYLE
ncbi:hypothetical protein EIP86_002687 [Pleurotus ostreatoroseus]|nr:hypothetical protein EIP86_002687 [Pleurotus ostreatoroseus]